jgi:hypothetical protein
MQLCHEEKRTPGVREGRQEARVSSSAGTALGEKAPRYFWQPAKRGRDTGTAAYGCSGSSKWKQAIFIRFRR